jgi:uncharacterized membrane protein
MRLALKTLSSGTLHIGVATAVAYALTGNLTAALGIGLIEPLVQTAVFAVHERLWESHPKPAPAVIAGA